MEKPAEKMGRSTQDFVDRSDSEVMQRTLQYEHPGTMSFKKQAAQEPLFEEVVDPLET